MFIFRCAVELFSKKTFIIIKGESIEQDMNLGKNISYSFFQDSFDKSLHKISKDLEYKIWLNIENFHFEFIYNEVSREISFNI